MMILDSLAKFLPEMQPNLKDSIRLIEHDNKETVIENITGRKTVKMKIREIKGKWVVFKTTKIDGITVNTVAKIKKAA